MSSRMIRVGDAIQLQRRVVDVQPLLTYEEVGVRSFGRGIFHKEPISGAELGNKRVFEIHPGDLVLSNVFAWEGAIALAAEAERGRIGSHRFMTYVADRTIADESYLRYFFLSEPGLALIRKASPGSAGRNRTLAIDRFEALTIPLPDAREQRRVAHGLDQALRALATVTEAFDRADALRSAILPSSLGAQFAGLDVPSIPISGIGQVRRGRGPRYLPDTGRIAINQGCVQWGGLDLRRSREVDGAWEESVHEAARASALDVLVNSTGEGTIGRACTVPREAVGLPFDSHVLAVAPSPEIMLPEFLAMFLRSPRGQHAIEQAKGANTTKQTELGKKKLENLLVPAPALDTQRQFVAAFDHLRDRFHELSRLDAQLRLTEAALIPSLLNHAFNRQS
jgi:type I restriction enzyme S subunit